MTPEERKAIAMRQPVPDWRTATPAECEADYPECCTWHEGFDAALRLLVPVKATDPFADGFPFAIKDS